MSKEIINQIEQLKERIEEKERDIKIYQDMIDAKKQEELALREKVERLDKQLEKEYGK